MLNARPKKFAEHTRGSMRGQNLQRVRVPELPKELLNWSLDYVSTCKREDSDISPALKWVEEGRLPSWYSVKGTSAFTRALYRQFDSLVIRNGVFTVSLLVCRVCQSITRWYCLGN